MKKNWIYLLLGAGAAVAGMAGYRYLKEKAEENALFETKIMQTRKSAHDSGQKAQTAALSRLRIRRKRLLRLPGSLPRDPPALLRPMPDTGTLQRKRGPLHPGSLSRKSKAVETSVHPHKRVMLIRKR